MGRTKKIVPASKYELELKNSAKAAKATKASLPKVSSTEEDIEEYVSDPEQSIIPQGLKKYSCVSIQSMEVDNNNHPSSYDENHKQEKII